MGAVLSWFAGHLVWVTVGPFKHLRPQEALEDSPGLSDGFVLEEGDLGADSLEWCERSTGGGDTSEDYFDSRSWHSDTLSDWSPDREDSLDALLGLVDTCAAQRAAGCSFHAGRSKRRRRESVTPKDAHTDATVRRGSCNWRKSSENHADLDVSGELCPIEIRPCPGTEQLKPDLHRDPAGSTETQISTGMKHLHAQSQHGTKVNDPADTQEVTSQPRESKTCTAPIETAETQQQQSTDYTSWCEEILSRESHPQGCDHTTTPQEEAWVSGVGTERCGCVGMATEGTKSSGTVNEICSSITFSTDSRPLFPCAPELTAVAEFSQRASPVPVAGQSQDLIANHLDQIRSEEAQLGSIEPGPGSAQTYSDTDKGSEGCLPPHLLLASPLFSSSNPESEDSSFLLSEELGGGRKRRRRRRVRSLCSLSRQNTEQEGEGGHVYLHQRQAEEAVSRVGLTQSHTDMPCENSQRRVIPRALANKPDTQSAQGVASEVEKTKGPAAAEPIQDGFTGCSGQAQEAISPTNTETTVSTISSLCNQILDVPEAPCSVESPTPLSDSNNNTKASAEGTDGGESAGRFSQGVQSSSESNEKTVETLAQVTSDLLEDADKPRENSCSSLDYEPNWSSEDSAVSGLGEDLDSRCQFSLAEVDELENVKTETHVKYSAVCTHLNKFSKNARENLVSFNSNTLNKESLDPLLMCLEDKSLLEDIECKEERQIRTVKYSHPDVSLNLLSVSSLEPILEAERSQESPAAAANGPEIETRKDQEIMRPAGKDGPHDVNVSEDICSPKSPNCQPVHEEDTLSTAESEPDLNPASPDPDEFRVPPLLRGSTDRHCRPVTVAYDTMSYTTNSSCDETEETKTKKSKIKGSQTGSKGSKFSVFAKMPSFRKAKGLKGAKAEESPRESPDGEIPHSSPLPEQELQGNNSDEEVFLKSSILSQTAQQLFGQGVSGEESGGLDQENPLLRQVQLPDVHTYKRSKSNDSLNIRMRFAQAHKSFSSLFESRSMDKENEEQATEGDLGKTKQSWKKLKKAKEAELLRRTISVPDEECSQTGAEQDHGDFMSSSILNRFSSPGSPCSLRALRHTDPISKRGVPQVSGKDKPRGCKSEGQRRKHSPNGLPSSKDDSAVAAPNDTSPLSPFSPGSLATLTHLHSPSSTRAPSVASEGVMESPLRPMSPKPNSPRPAAQRRVFRYPHSGRPASLSPILLGQSVSVEGLMDPPERPKTLKPAASPLALSLSPLETPESRLDSQSHISLYAIGSISEMEGTQNGGRPASQSRTRRLLETVADEKVSVVLSGLRTGSWVDNGQDGGRQKRRRCSDDLWIEEEKRYKRKLARAIRGSLGQLNTLLPEDMDKTRAGVALGLVEAFRGMPLKAHCFSQSTPIGLDCLGWRRHISYASEYQL
ncbi:hypothetical protein LDENG_00187780 [Lucifuga dentata]|nr:hypothetical protein LDENG_00187780 [Lucifuga dentata]